MPRWFANHDAFVAPVECEWAPWSRYTRMPPPDEWQGTAGVTAYTPQQQTLNSAVHEAAHAVAYMAGGYRIAGILLHPPGEPGPHGQAEVEYAVPASGPWLSFAVTHAAGERAETRWLRETGLWTPGRVWAAERHAWSDRMQVADIMRTCHNRELTFRGNHHDWGDYAWLMDRTDEALAPIWDQILTLAHHLAEHRQVTGDEAARIAGFPD